MQESLQTVALPWYNGTLEITHRLLDQKEFYDFCTKELTLEKANLKLRKYNNFSIINEYILFYIVIFIYMIYSKKLEDTKIILVTIKEIIRKI